MSLFADFTVIVIVATLAGAIATRLKQPSVIGLLIAGMLIGPHQLGLVQESEVVKTFADIGAVLLLFAIGLEFNLSGLKGIGFKAVGIAATKMGAIILLTYLASSLLGLNPVTGLFLGAILSITSTAIMIKVINEKNYGNRSEVKLLIASLIVEDILAVFLLAVFAGLGGAGEISFKFLFSIANSLIIFGLFYLVVSRVLKVGLQWLSEHQASETLAFAALSVGIGLSYLAQLVNIPASVGAFLAGNLISSVKQGEEFKQAIYPLIFIFSALFFLSIGMVVNLNAIYSNLWLVLAIAVIAIIIKLVAMGSAYYVMDGNSRAAAFAGVAMLSTGEFSLLIATLSKNIVSEIDLVGITSVLVLVTSLAMTFLIDRHEGVWKLGHRLVPVQLKQIGSAAAEHNSRLFSVFQTSNVFTNTVAIALGIIRDHLLLTAIIIGLAAYTFTNYTIVTIGGYSITYSLIGITTATLAILLIMFRIALKLYRLLKRLGKSYALRDAIHEAYRGLAHSLLIWLAIGIVTIISILNSGKTLVEAIVLVTIVIVVVQLFVSAKSEKKAIMWKK